MENGTAQLVARDLRRSFRMGPRRIEVLRGISMEVRRSEAVFLVGASGAGKTTLLYTLAGLERPEGGTVDFEGQRLYTGSSQAQAQSRNTQMGFVFQSYFLLPELTALENVMLPGMIGGSVRESAAEESLRSVGLGERLQHLPAELSGGEQQRVAIARALVNDPAIVFADEPTGNLDSKTGESLSIFVDGEVVPEGDAKVSVFDHGLLYGDGIFEGIRFYNGGVFRLEEHLERLWDSARSICLEVPMSRSEMTEALLETIRKNDLRDGYIRLIVTRGVGNLGLNPAQCKRPSVIIIATTIVLYPAEMYQRGLTVVTVATRRTGPGALNPAVKSLNYLNNVMARIEANLAEADEALMLNDQGCIAECTADNIFVIKRGEIFTPPITAGALRGITRSVVFEIAAELGIKISEVDISRHDVFIADECLLSGTAAEVIPVVKADGRVNGTGKPGPISLRMIARFREITREGGTPVYS